MGWWRTHSSLWARSPIHRYARRHLRDPDVFRCFSKSKPTAAQHKDGEHQDDGQRPAGMSHLQWLQLQQYKRWKKRLEEDPYRMLFGASEDMLKGRGLRDWNREWVERMFPGWMRAEMGGPTKGKDGSKEDSPKPTEQAKPKTAADAGYPRKVEIDRDAAPKEHDRMFPEPEIRPSPKFERDLWNSGVVSPSDSRRPREPPAAEKAVEDIKRIPNHSFTGQDVGQPPKEGIPQRPGLPDDSCVSPESTAEVTNVRSQEASEEPIARVSSFIDEFLADKPQLPASKSSGWRETALDRRAAPGYVPNLRRKTDMPIVDVTAKKASPSAPLDENTIAKKGFWPAMEKRGSSTGEKAGHAQSVAASTSQTPSASSNHGTKEDTESSVKHERERFENTQNEHSQKAEEAQQERPDASLINRKSASDILEQLPKDDMGFLSADQIRANMGRRRSYQEGSPLSRQQLEKNFTDVHQQEWQLDPFVESKIINDQHVRRKEREMLQAQELMEAERASAMAAVAEKQAPDTADALPKQSNEFSVLEQGLEFMSNWLKTGGDAFARHFWQDPVHAKRWADTDPFLTGVIRGIQKARAATGQAKEDLASDLPPLKQLLDRLTEDQKNVIIAARALRAATTDTESNGTGRIEGYRRISKVRQALIQTDKEFRQACESVDGLKASTKPSAAAKRRIQVATEIMQQTTKLTRAMIFGLQSRWESAIADHSETRVRDFAHRLLALQDTQLALVRVVARAMQVLDVEPKKATEAAAHLSEGAVTEAPGIPTGATVSSKDIESKENRKLQERIVAANMKLEDEIDAQKAAMRGLSDDGYSRLPRPITKETFEEPNPLAHSLFRPFGLQLESLGKDTDAAKTEAEEAAKKVQEDKELVKEVKQAYEDVYGPITVSHRQVESGKEELANDDKDNVIEKPEPEPVKLSMDEASTAVEKVPATVQLLKEDTVSPKFSATDTPAAAAEDAVTSRAQDVAEAGLKIAPKESVSADTTEEKVHQKYIDAANSVNEDVKTLGSASTAPSQYSAGDKTKNTVVVSTEHALPLRTEFTIYTYDPQTDEILATTSPVQLTDPAPPAIPLHEALAALSNPAKFVPLLSPNVEIITATPNMLVLRQTTTTDTTGSSPNNIHTIRMPASSDVDAKDDEWRAINPIDGTTRLSPTGYAGLDGLELEREFEERRRAAGDGWRVEREPARAKRRDKERSDKERRGGGAASVLKTAIVAAAGCYVVGVAGEVLR